MAAKRIGACAWCGGSFEAKNKNQIFCCKECQVAADLYNKRIRRRHPCCKICGEEIEPYINASAHLCLACLINVGEDEKSVIRRLSQRSERRKPKVPLPDAEHGARQHGLHYGDYVARYLL